MLKTIVKWKNTPRSDLEKALKFEIKVWKKNTQGHSLQAVRYWAALVKAALYCNEWLNYVALYLYDGALSSLLWGPLISIMGPSHLYYGASHLFALV